MGLIRGPQIATGSDGIETNNLVDNILSASASGRAKIQDGYFDLSTATAKFTTSSIPNNRLQSPVLALSGGTMTGDLVLFGAPQTDNSAARKVDVDRAVQGLDVKLSVRLKSGANIANTGSITLADFDGTAQGVTLVAGNRVLLTAQTASVQNGIYQVTGTALTRSSDADESSEVTANLFTFVEEGTYMDTGWVLVTDDPITLGSTGLTFSQFSGVGSVSFGTTISQVRAGIGPGAGTSSYAARVDHTHSVATGPATSISLTSSNTEGTSENLARADHTHVIDIPNFPTQSNQFPQMVGTASVAGTSGSVARADHVHEAPSWTRFHKGLVANDTTNNGQGELATNGAIATPALASYITVKVNGVTYRVGDSSNSASTPCYFSADGGVTGLDFDDIVSGSLLYWNGNVSGFRLRTNDRIDFCYLSFADN